MEKEIKFDNFVKRATLMTNKNRKVYLAKKNFKTLFCKLYNTRAKVVLKHSKKQYFGYSISNYNKQYIQDECIN
jgi:hypothetical protein